MTSHSQKLTLLCDIDVGKKKGGGANHHLKSAAFIKISHYENFNEKNTYTFPRRTEYKSSNELQVLQNLFASFSFVTNDSVPLRRCLKLSRSVQISRLL